jgi:4-amino-4-deoxy-L-arabinose transferase-like glycosyltransferase
MRSPYYLFTAAVIIALVGPSLIQHGMFMDGMIYATVARNFAEGLGTWWNLYLSDTLLTSYHDQPPMTMWIESFFFMILGDSIYTERVYSFFTALVNAWLIGIAWRTLYHDRPEWRGVAWLPVLLWIVVPVCFWSFANNMQENTMSIFVLGSLISLLRYDRSGKWAYLVAAGVAIFFASMCKGVQGTFLIAMPLAGWLVFRKQKFPVALLRSAILAAIPLAIYGILVQNETIARSLQDYFRDRLVSTFNDPAAATYGRFYLLEKLTLELAAPALLCLLIYLFTRRRTSGGPPATRTAVFFFILGLCGTLPLLVTREQRGFYLVTTLPFYAIGLASLIAGRLTDRPGDTTSPRHYRARMAVASLCMVAAITMTVLRAGHTRRDRDMLHDVHATGAVVPPHSTIGVSGETWRQWSLQLYFARHYYISLDGNAERRHEHAFFLGRKDMPADPQLHDTGVPLNGYVLYRNSAGK